MAIFDDVWIEKCRKVIGTIQSYQNYGAIETTRHRAIGYCLSQGGRSYRLLKTFYTRKPELFKVQTLIDDINGSEWYDRKFNWDEYLNVQDILVDVDSEVIQDGFFENEVRHDISNLLYKLVFTDEDTAIMAELLYWLTDEPRLNMYINNCGGARGTTIDQLRYSAMRTSPELSKRKLNECFTLLDTWNVPPPEPARTRARPASQKWIKGNRYLLQDERDNNASLIFNYLSAEGWTTHAICGVLGNMNWESTLNPGIWQDLSEGWITGGWGLVQWTPSTKYTDWANAKGYATDDGTAQCKWIHEESDQPTPVAPQGEWIATPAFNYSFREFIKRKDAPETMAHAYLDNFERAGDRYLAERQQAARRYFNMYKGRNPSKEPSKPVEDGNPVQKPDTEETIPNPTPTPEEPPDIVERKPVPAISVKKMLKYGNEYELLGKNDEGGDIKVTLYRERLNMWIPNRVELQAETTPSTGDGDSGGVPADPPTPVEPNKPKPDPTPKPPSGGNEKALEYVNLALQYVGNLAYDQDLDVDRFSFSDGYADCSSFVITLYYMITGTKLKNRDGQICTYTGNLKNAGKLLWSGDTGGDGVMSHVGDMRIGDIALIELSSGASDAHVVIYGGDDIMIHCKGKASGTVRESFAGYFRGNTRRPYYYIFRLFWED